MTDIDVLGVFRREGDELAVRLERRYETDVDDLWSALTDPSRLVGWFAEVTGDLHKGGEFRIVFDPEDPSQQVTGSVLECRPARRLSVSWRIEGQPTSTVSVELADDGAGALMVLEEQRLPLSQAAGYGAGWQAYLELLAAALDNKPGSGPGWADLWADLWAELVPGYREQLERVLLPAAPA